jgi:hypothetical protein
MAEVSILCINTRTLRFGYHENAHFVFYHVPCNYTYAVVVVINESTVSDSNI